MSFRFADPYFLVLLAPLLFFYGLLVFKICKPVFRRFDEIHGFRLSDLQSFRQAGLVASPWQVLFIPTLRVGLIALVILAIARPQYGNTQQLRKASGIDIVLALDVSGSMQALDFTLEGQRVDRLTMLKTLADEFVERRAGDRMGLVAFGAEAFTLTPATLDHELLQQQLSELQIGMAGDGTAIGDALGVAVRRLEGLDSKSRIVLLFTDGANNRGQLSPRVAAEIAASQKVKVYTVAIGQEGPVPVAAQGFFGMEQIVQRRFPIDFELLKEIAQKTGAQFYRAENTDQLRSIYQQIDALEKSEFEMTEYTRYEERMEPLVLSSLLLLFGEAILGRMRRLRRIS